MTDAAKIDPLKIAAGIAHGAAVNAMLAFGVAEDAAAWWSNAGAVRAGDPFDVADKLAATFCRQEAGTAGGGTGKQTTVTGERVWREASELRLHGQGGDAWARQDVAVATAFTVFGQVALTVYADLAGRRAAAIAAEAARKRAAAKKPVKVSETIYERLDDRNVRDPDMVKALERSKQQAAGVVRGGHGKPAGTAASAAGVGIPPAAAGDPGAPPRTTTRQVAKGGGSGQVKLSIGERPLDMAKQRKGKHGGKREKGK